MKNDSINELNAFIKINHQPRLKSLAHFSNRGAKVNADGTTTPPPAPSSNKLLNSLHYLYFYLQNKPTSLVASLLKEYEHEYDFNKYPDLNVLHSVEHEEHRPSKMRLCDLGVVTTTALTNEYKETKRTPDIPGFQFDDIMIGRLLCRQGTAASQAVRRFLGVENFEKITKQIETQMLRGARQRLHLTNIPELVDLGDRLAHTENPILIGREDVLDQIIDVMLMKKLNNPILLGDAGVGKSAIVEYLAWQMHTGDIDPSMRGHQILQWDLAEFMSDTQNVGQTEEKFKRIVNAIKDNDQVHLFMDEIHNVVGAGSSSKSDYDVSNMLKPHLTDGSVRLIGATTKEEYAQFIKPSKAFSRRFETIDIKEPTPAQTLEILKGAKISYEKHHGLVVSEEECAHIVDGCAQTRGHSPSRELLALDRACVRSRRDFEKASGQVSTMDNNTLKQGDVTNVLARQEKDRRTFGFAKPTVTPIADTTPHQTPHNEFVIQRD